MSAIISDCGTWRYELERDVPRGEFDDMPEGGIFEPGLTIGYYGVNGSTAGPTINDATVNKWIGFTQRNGGTKFIVGNVFAYRAADVRRLAMVSDPVGPENDVHLRRIIDKVDIHVPCWGNINKVPKHLRPRFDMVWRMLRESGKPMKIFGVTKDGYPKHPLFLPYSTMLLDI